MNKTQEGRVVAVADLQVVVDQTAEKTPVLAVKAKKLYRNVRPTVEASLYLRESAEDNIVHCFLLEDIGDMDVSLFTKESIVIKKAGWGLLSHIEQVSSRHNQLGMKLMNDAGHAENIVRYLLKSASFIDELKFEIDDSKYERIESKIWSELMDGEYSLPPSVMISMFRLIKNYN